jgi:hypothetical protein
VVLGHLRQPAIADVGGVGLPWYATPAAETLKVGLGPPYGQAGMPAPTQPSHPLRVTLSTATPLRVAYLWDDGAQVHAILSERVRE